MTPNIDNSCLGGDRMGIRPSFLYMGNRTLPWGAQQMQEQAGYVGICLRLELCVARA